MNVLTNGNKYELALNKFKENDFETAEELLESLFYENTSDFNTLYFLAVIKSKLGKYKEAISLYAKVLEIDPDHTEAHFNKALCHQHLGEEDDAIFHYSKAIQLNPLLNDAHNNIAVIYKDRGDMESVEKHVAKIFTNKFEGFSNALQSKLAEVKAENVRIEEIKKAIYLHTNKKYAEALEILEKLKAEESNIPEALFIMGNTYFHVKKIREAIRCFEKCSQLDPGNASAYYSLGFCYKELADNKKAEEYYKKAIEIKPDYLDALNNLGLLYYSEGKFNKAIEFFEKALEFEPKYIKAIVNIGSSKTFLNDFDAAMTYFDLAEKIAVTEDDNEILSLIKANKGFCYLRANKLQQALELFDESITLNPENVLSHYNKAEVLLKKGDFKNGWVEYEWRKKRDEFGKREFFKPLKKGVEIKNKRIFVYAEQGFGDAIHFVRYLKLLKEKGAYVILECAKELKDLFLTTGYIDEIIEKKPELKKREDVIFDYDVALLSLPLFFETSSNNIPADVPYLTVRKEKIDFWKRYVNGSKFKVGLVWAGSPGHKNDKNRSIRLNKFKELLQIKDVQFFSLQKGNALEQIKEFSDKIVNLDEYGIKTFEDTAAIIKNLDLLISVDTSVAHLAGALAKEVWTLIPFNADWRWQMDREDSPWYPTMRLFREKEIGQWEHVIKNLVVELKIKLGTLNTITRNPETENLGYNIGNSFKIFTQPIVIKEDKSITGELTEELFNSIISQLLIPENSKFLDLNCGEGIVLEKFREHGFVVSGATNNEYYYKFCKTKDFDVKLTDFTQIDFDSNSFDLIWARYLLEKSIAPFHILREIRRILNTDGIAYLEMYAPETPAMHEMENDNFSLFSMKVWNALIEKAGFKIITSDTIEFDLPNGEKDLHYYFVIKKEKEEKSTKKDFSKKENKKIIFALTEGENFGWGVCSEYLNRELKKKVEVANILENKELATSKKVEGKVFHALRNEDFSPLHQIWGDENYGYTFFEYELKEKAVQNAARYNKIFAGSSWCKQKMEEKGIFNTGILIQGVDPEKFYPDEKKANKNLFVIFSGGKFELRKGQDLVLKAVKILQEKYPDIILINSWFNMWPATMNSMKLSKYINFEISGNNWNEQIAHLVKINGLDNERVFSLPLVPNEKLREIYNNTDIGLFPNRCEGGTNLVLMEYMACGKPVVASFNTGHKDILTENNAILLKEMKEFKIYGENQTVIADWFEPELDEIISKLEWAYLNRDEIKLIGQNAAETMKNFTWEKSAESLLKQIFSE